MIPISEPLDIKQGFTDEQHEELRINYTTVRSSVDPDIKVKLSQDDSFQQKTRLDSIVDVVKQRI